ncbi:MAG: branched chain amino acid aminotransferase, partial [Muribaculaceae bacterium]|nr:branched chain amino acid aminotransferase [Muribaculaceae bacterium]
MQLAREMGMEVEQRHIELEELETVSEAAACGTAAVASPVGEVHDLDTGHKYVILPDGQVGPVVTELYNRLRGIQLGELPDVYGWNTVLD